MFDHLNVGDARGPGGYLYEDAGTIRHGWARWDEDTGTICAMSTSHAEDTPLH